MKYDIWHAMMAWCLILSCSPSFGHNFSHSALNLHSKSCLIDVWSCCHTPCPFDANSPHTLPSACTVNHTGYMIHVIHDILWYVIHDMWYLWYMIMIYDTICDTWYDIHIIHDMLWYVIHDMWYMWYMIWYTYYTWYDTWYDGLMFDLAVMLPILLTQPLLILCPQHLL